MTEMIKKNASDLDRDFRYEISEKVGAKSLLKCIQCGVCSSGCTVTEYVDMQPHRVVASCLLGLRKEVLSSQAIWTCSLCHRCTERCPKNVDYSFILALLRNMAVKEGTITKEYSGTFMPYSERIIFADSSVIILFPFLIVSSKILRTFSPSTIEIRKNFSIVSN